MKYTFDDAVNVLDDYLQRKTTHSTKDLLARMSDINTYEFATIEDHQDFSNLCSNFDKYLQATGLTSIGRKQFEKLWESGFQLPLGVDYQMNEDPLPDFDAAMKQIKNYSDTVDTSKSAHDLRVENTELRKEIASIKEELRAANRKLEAIRGIVVWG